VIAPARAARLRGRGGGADRVAAVLSGLPEGERAALVDHVERLANLTPAMRDAVLGLAVQLDGGGE